MWLALIFSILFVGLPSVTRGQLDDCDALGGCFCATTNNSNLYLNYIGSDTFDYRPICDPTHFRLRFEGKKLLINTDFHALVVIPLHKDPLNFKIDAENKAAFTTIRCEDGRGDKKENALVHADSNEKKNATTIEALGPDPQLDYHVFIVHFNKTLDKWTQLPRALCRHDATSADYACLPVDCSDCDGPGEANAELVKKCNQLKAEHWPPT